MSENMHDLYAEKELYGALTPTEELFKNLWKVRGNADFCANLLEHSSKDIAIDLKFYTSLSHSQRLYILEQISMFLDKMDFSIAYKIRNIFIFC